MRRRGFLAFLAAGLAAAAARLPANANVKWALSLGLWNQFRPWPFTDILDVMRDTGFIGIRLTGFPGFLKTYNLTPSLLEKEISRRKLHVATISFGGPAQDPDQLRKVIADARLAMGFLKTFGARELVVFPPGRLKPEAPEAEWLRAFDAMCECYNRLGEVAGEMGFRAGLHNHLDALVEKPGEIELCMAKTNPRLFHLAPDTAHMHLGGARVVEMFEKYKRRLIFMDYKDAKWTTPETDLVLDNGRVEPKESKSARFFSSIYDLGDGEIDFPGCHRVLKDVSYKGWICVDLDFARRGPRASYERCGAYITERLEPIYR